MSANEIAERLAAACWVQCGGGDAEAINALNNSRIRYRSQVGFRQQIITTTDPNALPVLILPLDRTLSRAECAVFAARLGTAGPAFTNTNRAVYPNLGAPVPDVPQVFVQPILLEWLGPDLTNPQFFPFGITNGAIPLAPPTGANLNLFDAIAVLLPVPLANASSGDFCVMVLKHPRLELATELEDLLPVPVTDVFALARAWFRADTFEVGGEDDHLTALVGRIGTEGNLEPDSSGYDEPEPDPLLNNQLAIGPSGSLINSTAPANYWNFLASGTWTFYGVAYATIVDEQQYLLWTPASDINLLMAPSLVDGELSIVMKSAWAQSEMEYPDTDANVGQWTKIVVNEDVPNGMQLTNTAAGVNEPALTGLPPAPGVFTDTLSVNGRPANNGQLVIAELLFWDFVLSPAQQATVESYLNTRYGTPVPPADPILGLNPTAWFRGDTFTQSGGFFQALTGRVGTEGNLVAQVASYPLPSTQTAAADQLGLQYGDQANNDIISSMPAAFWNFLATENSWFGAVFLVPAAGIVTLFQADVDSISCFVNSSGVDTFTISWGAGAVASFTLNFAPANIGVAQSFQSRQDASAAQPITVDLFPAGGQNGGSFSNPPSGVVGAPLTLGRTSSQSGPVVLLDLIFFDRALSSGEIAVWDKYIVNRYGL